MNLISYYIQQTFFLVLHCEEALQKSFVFNRKAFGSKISSLEAMCPELRDFQRRTYA